MDKNLTNSKQVKEFEKIPNKIEEEIDLHEIITVIWQGKWLVAIVTTLFLIASIILAVNLPNVYKSEVLLAPADTEQGGGLAALAGQFGGLASLAGINLDAKGGVDKTQMAMEVLKSRQFISGFINRHNILPEIMAPKKWDMTTNSIIFDEQLYISSTNTWVRDVDEPFKPKPSMQEAYKEFIKIFSVHADKETGMIKLSVEHISPFIAKQWVNWLVEDINNEMKERDVAEASRSTNFLLKQIEQTSVADIRSILYKLIEEQAKIIMFAEVREEYVFKTIDPAITPLEKHKPMRALICLIGVMLGSVISIMYLLSKHFLRNRS